MIKFKFKRKREKVQLTKKEILHSIISVLILVGISQAILQIPLKYITKSDFYSYQGPGNPNNINKYIQVENEQSDNNNFYITYVSSAKAHNLSELLGIQFYNSAKKDFPMERVPNPEVIESKTMTEEELVNYYVRSTQQSMKNAVYVAYTKAGKELKATNEGIVVSYVRKDKEYKRTPIGLKQGDYILAVNNKPISNKIELAKTIIDLKENSIVKIKVSRDGKEIIADHRIITIDGVNYLGVTVDEGIDLSIPKEIEFDQMNVQGSSAGLMFTLYMIDQLTPESDLSKGYKVAGTGTINYKGDIGQIGGVDYKLEGAIKGGFDVFFVPKDINKEDSNEKIAKKVLKKHKSNIKVVPVSNIDEALSYLNSLTPEKKDKNHQD